LGVQCSICPSFSPKFNISSPSKGVFYENSVQFLGIQDANRLQSFLSFSETLISKFRLNDRDLFIADSRFCKLINGAYFFGCSDFPALVDLSGSNNFVVLFTFPGVDENRSMAIALFEADVNGVVVCSEIIPNLFGCLSDIKLVVNVDNTAANRGIYLGVTDRAYPLSADQMQLYSVAIKKEAVEAFFSVKNAELYWARL
jgi:hypothetical protein